MFSSDVSNLTIEILAAVVAVVMVVVSVAVTLYFQMEYEADKEFKTEVFKAKLEKYYEILVTFSRIDDDDTVDTKELNEMRNLSRSVALIAKPNVVITLANFIQEVEKKKQLFIELDDLSNPDDPFRGTFRNLVIQMRTDLEVVESEKTAQVREAIRSLVDPSAKHNGA